MTALNEYAYCKVSTTDSVDMKTAAKTVLYTVPTAKVFYPVSIIVRNPSASMAGGTDYDIGTGANADTWLQTVDLSSLTTANTDFMVVSPDTREKFTECEAASEFGIKVITGTTAACTASIDVFGFLA